MPEMHPFQLKDILPKWFDQLHYLYYLPSIDSTNRFCHYLSDAGVKGPLLVYTDHQIAGQGRGLHAWSSQEGKDLAVSMMLNMSEFDHFPERSTRIFYLNMLVALAVVKGCSAVRNDLRIKFPNDIYIGDRKLAGVLIEILGQGRDAHIVIGLGVNVNSQWGKALFPAVSMSEIIGESACRVALCAKILKEIERLARNASASDVFIEWQKYSYFQPGDPISYKLLSGKVQSGYFQGFTHLGQICIEQQNETFQLRLQEVIELRKR